VLNDGLIKLKITHEKKKKKKKESERKRALRCLCVVRQIRGVGLGWVMGYNDEDPITM
jgi:hypothetical protein